MTSQFPFMLAELGDALLHAGCAKRVVRLRELIAEAIPGLPSGIQLAKSIEQGNTKLGVLWRNYYALLLACAGGCVAQSQRLLHPESPELNPSSKPLATPPPLPPVLPPPPPYEDDEDNKDEGRGHVSEAPFEEAPPTSFATLPATFDRLVATARGGEGSTEKAIWGDGDLGGEGSTKMGMWLMGPPHAGFNGYEPPPPPQRALRVPRCRHPSNSQHVWVLSCRPLRRRRSSAALCNRPRHRLHRRTRRSRLMRARRTRPDLAACGTRPSAPCSSMCALITSDCL